MKPHGEISRTLVPDVAFLSFARMPFEEQERTGIPHVSPDVVVEVRSPDDLQADIDEKVRVYLAAGTAVVFLVDPNRKTITVVDTDGSKIVLEDGVVEHDALPEFHLPAGRLFESNRP